MSDAVLLPVFDEGATVGAVLDAVRGYFSGCVIVVDDGSRDQTAEVLAARDDIDVVTLSRNRGYGFALSTGFGHARRVGV
ncbi:MAG: glycosyltransferase, partial [Coriobacteriales bacterium]|nr:glycosyltransferase [Coriobacteriales bacterium]